MKRFLFKTITCIVIGALIYVSFILIFSIWIPILRNQSLYKTGFTSNRLLDTEKIKDIDVVFLGSSHAYRGFDPKNFSFSSFNIGTTAQTPIQSYVLIKKHLKKMNPKLVIYEVYPETFEISGLESQLDLLSNSKINFDLISTTFELKSIEAFNLIILNFLNYTLLGKPILRQTSNNIEHYFPNGYVETQNNTFKPNVINNNGKWNPLKIQLKYFRKCLNYLEKNNTKVLLVFAPITAKEYNSYENIEYFNDLMKKTQKYINFNNTFFDNIYFYDSHHLNKSGVSIFNKKLDEYISKNIKFKKS